MRNRFLNFTCALARDNEWPDVFKVRCETNGSTQTVYRHAGETNESLWARLNDVVTATYRALGESHPCIVWFEYDMTPEQAALVDDDLDNFRQSIRHMAKHDPDARARSYAQGLWADWVGARDAAPPPGALLQ